MTTLDLYLTTEASSLLPAIDVEASATKKLLWLTFSSCFACIASRRYQFPMNSLLSMVDNLSASLVVQANVPFLFYYR